MNFTDDLLQNFQNSDSSCKRPKQALQVASRLRDFVTMSTLEKNDLAGVKKSTKDAFRMDYFLVIDRFFSEFESRFMIALPLFELISALDVDSPHFLDTSRLAILVAH